MEKVDRDEVDELLMAISNAAHSEYHYLELLMHNDTNKAVFIEKHIVDTINQLRGIRISLMDSLCYKFPNTNPLWCTIKHLLLLNFHLLEMVEKDKGIIYLTTAKDVWVLIKTLLKDKEIYKDFKKCSRCDDDKIYQ